jgi:hypothetical protein
MIAEFVAVFCAGLFSGAAGYIALVQQPVIRKLETTAALDYFSPMYARAMPIQLALALLGFLAGLWAWWTGSGWLWVIGAFILIAVIPYTLILIKPTNDRLMDPTLDGRSPEAEALLTRWGHLHAVRSGLSCLAFLIFTIAI